ncbi:cerebellin-1-like [Mya arenaria]|uniref:cerebellin-1-like n=1 Tax=Mya arenaria TaxID=6604 RepID=UPI0022E91903|nr:cerebellin-1-like [Mya arenaria]
MESRVIRTYLVLLCFSLIFEIEGVSVHKINDLLDGKNEDIGNLGKNIDSQNDLNVHVLQLMKEVKTLKEEVTLMREQCTLHATGKTKEHNIQKRAPRRRVRRRKPEVAFQVVLKKKSEKFHTNQPINFDHVITNIGNGFDIRTGIFIAPIGGVYVFSATILAANGYYVEGSIVVHDETTVTAVSDRRQLSESSMDTSDQGTVHGTFRIQKGDTVSFMIKWPHGQHELVGYDKTSFGGHLVTAHKS